jgi:thiosulfate/3-mercaptopyruvate sulfurtransferase
MNMKTTATTIVGLLTILVCSFSYLHAGETAVTDALSPVVSTDWLAEHLTDPDLITLHMGPPGSYDERHIPGARSASLRRMIRVNEAGIRDEMLPAEDIAEALSELGIGNSSRIVVYFSEEGIAWGVARYLLTLEYVGMTGRVAYLDGGLPKWVDEERPVTTESQSVVSGEFTATTAPNVLVDTDWLSARLDEPGIAVVDGRPEEGYSGLAGHWDRLGHIPGAVNIPFFTLMAEDPPYLLKSREELSQMFREAGAEPGDTLVVYCGTGLWGSLPYLAARYLDYEVRLYDGSYQEWSATESLPIVVSGKSDDSDG